MVKKYYNVIEGFDAKKDYGIYINPQYKKCLSVLKKGQKVCPFDFVHEHINEFTNKPRSFNTNREIVYHSFAIAKKLYKF